MKKLFYILIPVIVLIIGYTMLGGQSGEDYTQQVEEKRDERVRFLRNAEASPFRQAGREFKQPEYFPISPEYKVRAKLTRLQSVERVRISNSDGTTSAFVKFAYASFRLKDQDMRLLILKPVGFGQTGAYFTGFADQTSGETTYGGGRYLDLEIGNSDNITIDFNLAYNPYCAYVNECQCPLPPAENILPVAIEAGEKDYRP